MQRLFNAVLAVAVLFVLAILAFWTVMEARASERVYVSAYCLERPAIEALLVADRKGEDAIRTARRGLFASGACKDLPHLILGRIVADHGIFRGRKCDWRVVQIQVRVEPLPVWSAAPRNCGQTAYHSQAPPSGGP